MKLNLPEILDNEIDKRYAHLPGFAQTDFSDKLDTPPRQIALAAMEEVASHWRLENAGLRKELGELLEEKSRFPAIALIAAERHRQLHKKGWSLSHDDEHAVGELAMAAMCYCMDPVWRPAKMAPMGWPWVGGDEMDGFKASPDNRIRELVKAGALIAAEIERLQRIEKSKTAPGTETGGR